MAITAATAIAAAAPAVFGAIGNLLGRGSRKKGEKLAQDAFDEIDALGLPPNEAIPLMLEKFKSAGIYTPELEQEINQQVSKVSQITEDSSLKDAQMSALESLSKSGRTGLTAQDRANYNKMRQDVQRDAEAKRQQIIQNMQARGQAGGGAELAASLLSSQAAADQQSASGDEMAGAASERALQAMAQAGQLGGSIRGQDLAFNKTTAEAADEMERFNVQNAINRQMRNVGSKNQGQQLNLAQQQAIMDANTQMANRETQRQSDARRQYYGDVAGRAQARAQAQLNQANIQTGKAASTANMMSGIGSGVGAAAGAIANKQAAPAATSMTQLAKPKEETPDEYYMREGYKVK